MSFDLLCGLCLCACMCACMPACVCVCVRECVRVCVWCRLYLLVHCPWISALLLLYCPSLFLFFLCTARRALVYQRFVLNKYFIIILFINIDNKSNSRSAKCPSFFSFFLMCLVSILSNSKILWWLMCSKLTMATCHNFTGDLRMGGSLFRNRRSF